MANGHGGVMITVCIKVGCPTLVSEPGRDEPRSRLCEVHADASRPKVTVVCGRPCAGKSTYVRERREPGDLVVDLDELHAALGLLPVHDQSGHAVLSRLAFDARDAVLDRLARRPTQGLKRAWIIATAPTREERRRLVKRFRRSELVVLDTSAEKCLRRLHADPVRAQDLSLVRELAVVINTWEPELPPPNGGAS